MSDTGRAHTIAVSRFHLGDPRRPQGDYLERRLALDTALRRRAYLAGSTSLSATVMHEDVEAKAEDGVTNGFIAAEVNGVNVAVDMTPGVTGESTKHLLSLEAWYEINPPMTVRKKKRLLRRTRDSMNEAADTPPEAWPAVDVVDMADVADSDSAD